MPHRQPRLLAPGIDPFCMFVVSERGEATASEPVVLVASNCMGRLRDVNETEPVGPEQRVSPKFAMASRHSNLDTRTARLGDAALTDGVRWSRRTVF